MKGRLSQVLIHIAGCVTFLALPIVFAPDARSLSDLWKYPPALRDFVVYLALLLFFYLNYFWLIPNYYFKRKYAGFFLIVLLCFVAIVLVPNMLIQGHPPREGYEWPANNPIPLPSDRPPRDMYQPPQTQHPDKNDSTSPYEQEFSPPAGPPLPPRDSSYGPGPQQPGSRSLLPDVSHQAFLFLAVFFFSLILKVSYRWRQTENDKLHAELSYLKAQINPHFLFNILNTIYSLAIEKSDQTGTAVVKLSQMMRYVINSAGNRLVPLSWEIDYLSNYIELQKMRFGNTVPLSFIVTGKATGQLITPLILISFVENAFKYGVNTAENTDIRITLNIDEKQLHFTAFNNKVTVNNTQETEGGLGINNTRKRLQLLYPGRHTLTIRDGEHYFEVSLSLQLA